MSFPTVRINRSDTNGKSTASCYRDVVLQSVGDTGPPTYMFWCGTVSTAATLYRTSPAGRLSLASIKRFPLIVPYRNRSNSHRQFDTIFISIERVSVQRVNIGRRNVSNRASVARRKLDAQKIPRWPYRRRRRRRHRPTLPRHHSSHNEQAVEKGCWKIIS